MSPAGSGPAGIAAAHAASGTASLVRRPDCGPMTKLTGAATPAHTAGRTGKPGPAGTATSVPAAVRAGTPAPHRGCQRSRAVGTLATPAPPTRTGRAPRMVPTARAEVTRSGKARQADPPDGGTGAGAAGAAATISQPGRRDRIEMSGRARHRPRPGPAETTNSSRCRHWMSQASGRAGAARGSRPMMAIGAGLAMPETPILAGPIRCPTSSPSTREIAGDGS
jgi:hypothetical protein